jgi:hypothetical protein
VKMHSGDTQELRNALLVRAYDQAIAEYESWDTYMTEQRLSFREYGRDDLMDLSIALLSQERRVRYPLAALDLAAYTIAKFGLDSDLAKYPVRGSTYNDRTAEDDPCQLFDLNVRFGLVLCHELHFGGHLLARCAVFAERSASDYLDVLLSAGVYPHDIVVCAQREMQRVAVGACPYERDAQRLCGNHPDGLRRAEEFFADC